MRGFVFKKTLFIYFFFFFLGGDFIFKKTLFEKGPIRCTSPARSSANYDESDSPSEEGCRNIKVWHAGVILIHFFFEGLYFQENFIWKTSVLKKIYILIHLFARQVWLADRYFLKIKIKLWVVQTVFCDNFVRVMYQRQQNTFYPSGGRFCKKLYSWSSWLVHSV